MNEKAGFFKRIKLTLRQPEDSVVFRTADGVWEHKLDTKVLALPQYKRFHHLDEFAIFSALVYRQTSMTDESGTDPLSIPAEWQRVLSQSDVSNLVTNKKSVDGLKYEAWYSAEKKQLIITFRGTGKRLGDWFSNFRWVTRVIPGVHDHYDLVRENIEGIIKRATAASGEIDTIVATGHSLGGGLAQHAAYSSPQISVVYAFNPTPVTGYTSVDTDDRSANSRDLFIARIFEHGEVLAYMRFGLRHFYKISKESPTIVELRFNYQRKAGGIREHGMIDFAKNVWRTAHQSHS